MGMVTRLGGLAVGALLLSISHAGAIELRPDGAYCLTSEESLDVGQQWSYSGGKIRNARGNCLQEVDAIGGGVKLVVHECAPYRGQNFSVQGAVIRTNSGGCVTFSGRSGTQSGIGVSECKGSGGQILNLTDDFAVGSEAQIKGYP